MSDTWLKPEDFGSFGSGHVISSAEEKKATAQRVFAGPSVASCSKQYFPRMWEEGLSEDVRTIGKQTLHRDHKCCVIWLQVLRLSSLDMISSVLLLTWTHCTPVWTNSYWCSWNCGKSLSVPPKLFPPSCCPSCLVSVVRVPLQIAENTYPCL